MEKSELQDWEYKWIQEEPPQCTAGLSHPWSMAGFRQAGQPGGVGRCVQNLRRTMPFPKIVGRICDHPCEPLCKRGDVGAHLHRRRAIRNGTKGGDRKISIFAEKGRGTAYIAEFPHPAKPFPIDSSSPSENSRSSTETGPLTTVRAPRTVSSNMASPLVLSGFSETRSQSFILIEARPEPGLGLSPRNGSIKK